MSKQELSELHKLKYDRELKQLLEGMQGECGVSEGAEMIRKFKVRKNSTTGEYQDSLETYLMQDERHPEFGYRPIDVKERIDKLLEIERAMKK